MIKPKIKYLVFSEKLEVEGITSEQAADAYSDMIDALIEYDKMFHENHKFSGSMKRSVVEKGRKAFIKAGVQL